MVVPWELLDGAELETALSELSSWVRRLILALITAGRMSYRPAGTCW